MDYILSGFVKAIELLINGDASTWSAVLATLQTSTIAIIASLILGLPCGFFLGYYEFKYKRPIRTLLDTLLALPTVCVGLLVYALVTSRGPLGEYNLLFSITGIAIGQTILAFPIVTAITASVIENIDRNLKLTLTSLGAGKRDLIATCLWESRFALLSGAVTAYGRVLTEVGIAMMVGGNIKYATRTITTAIALETNKGMFADGMALGIVLMAIALLVNICLSFLRKK